MATLVSKGVTLEALGLGLLFTEMMEWGRRWRVQFLFFALAGGAVGGRFNDLDLDLDLEDLEVSSIR